MLPVLKYELQIVSSGRFYSLQLRKLDKKLRRFLVESFEALAKIATCVKRRVAERQRHARRGEGSCV